MPECRAGGGAAACASGPAVDGPGRPRRRRGCRPPVRRAGAAGRGPALPRRADGPPLHRLRGETTHPDKGTELLVYELGVDERWRRRGIGTALVRALADRARHRGCFGMWVLTDRPNEAELATYRRAGAVEEGDEVMLG